MSAQVDSKKDQPGVAARFASGGILALVAVLLLRNPMPWLLVLAVPIFLVAYWELRNIANPDGISSRVRATLRLPPVLSSVNTGTLVRAETMVFYLGNGLVALWCILDPPYAHIRIACVVMADACAWLVGSIASWALGLIGIESPKLASKISPNKTWIGAIAGVVGGVLLAQPLARVLGPVPQLSPWLLLRLAIVAVAAISGDLLESALKRSVEIKDTSGVMPGHGGVLDRFDSLPAGFIVDFLVWFIIVLVMMPD